jgi:hypothetical protein
MKQVAAIIQSEGVFIDTSPLGKAGPLNRPHRYSNWGAARRGYPNDDLP